MQTLFLVGVLAAAPSANAVPMADWSRFSVITPAGPAEPAPEALKRLNSIVWTQHVIQHGDSIWKMAPQYGTDAPSIQATNNNEFNFPIPGTPIVIHNKKGLLYLVKAERETLDSIIARYRKDAKDAKKLKEDIVSANNLPGTALLAPYELTQGETLLLPKVYVKFDSFAFPFSNWRISSRFSRSRFHPILKIRRPHMGIDLPKPYGTPVHPARSGVVIFTGVKSGYGQMVEVRHKDGTSTVYGHLSQISVEAGQKVEKGRTMLGKVGSSGLSTGPHLHFEIRDANGRQVNPIDEIAGRRRTAKR